MQFTVRHENQIIICNIVTLGFISSEGSHGGAEVMSRFQSGLGLWREIVIIEQKLVIGMVQFSNGVIHIKLSILTVRLGQHGEQYSLDPWLVLYVQ